MKTRLVRRLVAISTVVLAALAWTTVARAATITVGSFAQFGGGCTLGNAILTAKSQAPIGGCVAQGAFGADVIVLPVGTYTVEQQDGGNAFPAIDRDITIAGNGSTIARPFGIGQNFRFFRVTAGHLKLLGLTLSGGRVTNANGGAILVSGGASLTLAGVGLHSNLVDSPPLGAKGGAIAMGGGGVLTAIGSEFIDNAARSAPAGGNGLAHGGAINVDTGAPVVVNLIDSTFQGNVALANGASGGATQGGAVSFEGAGSIAITNCTFLQNWAQSNGEGVPAVATGAITGGSGGSALGGAIYMASDDPAARLDIAASVFRQNAATSTSIADADAGTQAFGGGVHVDLPSSNFTVRDSRFQGNTADASSHARGGAARGGGLFAALGGAGTAAIVRSAFVQNTLDVSSGVPIGTPPVAVASGAGIRIEGTANLSISASTIALNAISANSVAPNGTQGQGAGIHFASTSQLTLLNDTVAGNTITATNGSAQGGALAKSGPATIQNSIFSGNAAETAANCFGAAPTSLGNNLFADGGACGNNGSDIVGVPAGLGALTDSGQPAGLVLPLLAGSPAIAAANSSACPVVDQLGHGREGLCDIGAVELVPSVPLTTLVAAVLPSSRAGLVGTTITAFVSVINAGTVPAYQVGLKQSSDTPTFLTYQTTNPATNLPTGQPNTPVDIPPGATQTYVIALLITGQFAPTDIALTYAGTNTLPVAALPGLNTLLASGSVTPIPDVVALAATAGNNGTIELAQPLNSAFWSGAFAVATVNLGAAAQITVAPSVTGGAPAILAVCETEPATGACKSAPEPTPSVFIGSGATPTFAVFVQSPTAIAFDPATNRIFLYFKDGGGAIRGGTSVAVRTLP